MPRDLKAEMLSVLEEAKLLASTRTEKEFHSALTKAVMSDDKEFASEIGETFFLSGENDTDSKFAVHVDWIFSVLMQS